MSNPELNAATQQEPTAPVDSTNTSLEERLAIAEQRQKDTQAAYTKGQQTLKSLEAEKAKLLELVSQQVKVSLTTEEQESLDSLMYEDPKAWREQMNSLETKASSEARANLEQLTGEAKRAAESDFELSRRQQVLEDFNASAKVAITEELIANEVPPRITRKLAEGKITFDDFLQEVSDYVNTGKVIKNEETLNQPNLGKAGGSVAPKDSKPDVSLSSSYANDIY
jgi:hypothetical protein